MNFQIAMKSVFVIYLLCLFPFCRAEAANHFRDVPADHWSYDVLQELHSRGIISSVIPASSNIDDMYDDDMGIANWGERGWEIGGSWALEKNVGLVASYFWGSSITSHRRMKSVLARLEMFF